MLLSLAVLAGPVMAEQLHPFTVQSHSEGRTITFAAMDVVRADQETIPRSGWVRDPLDRIRWYVQRDTAAGTDHSLWGRVRFDGSVVGHGALAIYTQDNREQIKVFVNGEEIFRNYAKINDRMLGWYRPYLIPLPEGILRQGTNEIVIQASSSFALAVGRIQIGAQGPLQSQYTFAKFVRITGPIIANSAMLILGLGALIMWSVRRSETELLFFALTAVTWMARDYHFFADRLPYAPQQFYDQTVYALYFATASSTSFCLVFLKIPERKWIIPAMFGFGVGVGILHTLFQVNEMLIYGPTFFIAILTAALGIRDLRRASTPDHWLLSAVMASLTLTSTHDFGRNEELWEGLGFYIQPYIGFTFTLVFMFSFGRRSLAAFKSLGEANKSLELGIAKARDELAASETQRRALEVDRAIVSERERLMREMHDGIGSNLVTALAIAERQHQPGTTIKTLKRAISDLKITVDSLEPVKGDLVALIGNLRHRMRLDLRAAGLSSKWEVGDCGPLAWLDAANALHVLRIFQEAISNVISHSGATIMRIGCLEEARDGILGIVAFVADNGVGFDPNSDEEGGKGLSNMRSRTKAIGGIFSAETEQGKGTELKVWLPYDRDR
jgi:signal transduction histidine kinase